MNNDHKILPSSQSSCKVPSTLADSDFTKISDENLYFLCKTYGTRALIWRQKFIGLLPEVYRRKLFEKKGFESIFIFAKKLAGLSEDQVRITLNLEKRFENFPELKSLLVNGEVSVNKLARVVSIANVNNQSYLADSVKILSKGAVETLVRDEKCAREMAKKDENLNKNFTGKFENQNGLFEPRNDRKSLPGQTFAMDFNNSAVTDESLGLSSEVQQKLIDLKNKGFDINQLILEFLQKREEEITQEKQRISREVLQKEREKRAKGEKISRSRPVKVQKILQEEYGTKCSIQGCQKLAEQTHHVTRFSITRTNNPYELRPLCKDHHQITHAKDLLYFQMRNTTLA